MTLTPEATLGILALFGITIIAILMMLKRFGVIKFANGGQCSDHNGFCDAFKTLKNEHIKQGEAIRQHEKQLSEGKTTFKQITKDIAEIKENIAVLLDRSNKRRVTD